MSDDELRVARQILAQAAADGWPIERLMPSPEGPKAPGYKAAVAARRTVAEAAQAAGVSCAALCRATGGRISGGAWANFLKRGGAKKRGLEEVVLAPPVTTAVVYQDCPLAEMANRTGRAPARHTIVPRGE